MSAQTCQCKCCRKQCSEGIAFGIYRTGGGTFNLDENITDTDRLEWVIENQKVVTTNGARTSFGVSFNKDSGFNRFKTPREAIDAAMKESNEKSGA